MENENLISETDQHTMSTQASGKPGVTLGQAMLPASILIAAVVISLSLFLTRGGKTVAGQNDTQGQDNAGNEQVQLSIADNDRILGSPTAPLTLYEFSDFQCPFCRKFFNETYTQLKKNYVDTGKLKIVYRHMPLSFHPAARPAALAAECAGDQGKFWEFHDTIFQEQSKLNPKELTNPELYKTITFGEAEIKGWASKIPGIDSNAFNECLAAGTHNDKVGANINQAMSIGINGTPTFVLNGKLIVGAQPFEAFSYALDQSLEQKK